MHRFAGPYDLVDISMWLDGFTFPGDAPVEVTGPFNFLTGANPEYVHHVSMPTQAGTHIQGPRYFLAGGSTIETFPLKRFEGEAVVVDLPGRGRDTELPEFLRLLGGRDLTGRILLLRTGHMAEVIRDGRLDAARRPGLSLEVAHWLADSGVSMVAIDSVGVESRVTTDYDVNVALCRAEVLLLEGLLHLERLGPGPLWLEAFPLKLAGVEGTPCRAVVKDYSPR